MLRAAIFAVLLYLAGYIGFRSFNTEVWEKDGRAYVIFPADFLPIYYLFRPVSYVDGMVTGMGAHIGPHQ